MPRGKSQAQNIAPNDVLRNLKLVPILHIANALYKIETTSGAELRQSAFERYHGKGNKVSQIELFYKGDLPYENFYDHPDDCPEFDSTADGQENNGNPRIIPRLFHRQGQVLIMGTNVSLSHLKTTTKSAKNECTGQYIWSQAEEALKHLRKALALSKKYFNSDGSWPSGGKKQDLWEFVNRKMFEAQYKPDYPNGGTSVCVAVLEEARIEAGSDEEEVEGAEGDDDEGRDDVPAMPRGWMFPGFIAFCFFSPDPPSTQFKLDLLAPNAIDSAVNRKHSRSNRRKEKADEQENARQQLTTPGPNNKRGVNLRETFQMTSLHNKIEESQTRKDEMIFLQKTSLIRSTVEEVKFAIEMAKLEGGDKESEEWKEVKGLRSKLRKLNEDLESYNESKRRRLEKAAAPRSEQILLKVSTTHLGLASSLPENGTDSFREDSDDERTHSPKN